MNNHNKNKHRPNPTTKDKYYIGEVIIIICTFIVTVLSNSVQQISDHAPSVCL